MAHIIKNRYGMWERTRFNKLKENDWFTFRTGANITDVYSDDVLFKIDCEFSTEDSCQKVNCMSCGGATVNTSQFDNVYDLYRWMCSDICDWF